jgi:transcriptional regulator with XRE-family HTH domain
MAEYDAGLLRSARILAGLTAADLAARAGLHPVTVSGFERGLRPSAETWARIKKALREALAEQARKVAKAQKDIAA